MSATADAPFNLSSAPLFTIADSDWPETIRAGRMDELIAFTPAMLAAETSQVKYVAEKRSV
jgi:hypothetical protein